MDYARLQMEIRGSSTYIIFAWKVIFEGYFNLYPYRTEPTKYWCFPVDNNPYRNWSYCHIHWESLVDLTWTNSGIVNQINLKLIQRHTKSNKT